MIGGDDYTIHSDHERSEDGRFPFKTRMESRAAGDVLFRLLTIHPRANVMITSIPAKLDAPPPRWQEIAFEDEEILETFMSIAEKFESGE